jgi:2-methylisocitrate lyase-like PEP mutase family enzyme
MRREADSLAAGNFREESEIMTSQASKAAAFQALHEQPGTFVIPNPWDAGSARILASFGFKALATTSAGAAFTLGRPDGGITRAQSLENARAIVEACDLPVSADLENCFGDAPEFVAETIQLAAQAGLVGGSVEDSTGRADEPIYPFEQAVARVKAAVAAARKLSFPFMVTARSENFLHGRADLDDTLRRLQAYAEAGADVLFAPGLKSEAEISAVIKAVAPKPVNVLMGLAGATLSVDTISRLGAKRISTGGSLARAALSGLFRAAEEIQSKGTFGFAADAVPHAKLNTLFRG